MGPGRTALITGATGAIGSVIAAGLADRGWEVVLVARDQSKTEGLVECIRESGGTARAALADVSLRSEVERLAAEWSAPLQLLVNNAAAAPRRRLETSEGVELQFATNVLSYFWMTECFAELLEASAPSRVVNVASYWAGGLDLSDLEFRRRRYNNGAAYRQSKQANRMLSRLHGLRFAERGIAVCSCHPGDVDSSLSRDLGFGGHESPEQGADTPLWLADAADIEVSARYFSGRIERQCEFAGDSAAASRLYAACSEY